MIVTDARADLVFDDGLRVTVERKGILVPLYGGPEDKKWYPQSGKSLLLREIKSEQFLQINDYDYRRPKDILSIHITESEREEAPPT